jgi:hypothetical protein
VKKLPIIGSTAATTSFVSARVEGPRGTFLVLDGNSKITRDNGTYAAPSANAFSLPSAGLSGIEHCPGSTPTCRKSCYVENLATAQPDLYAAYESNARNIRAILADKDLANEWAMIFASWIRQNAAGGFRFHVSGDVFSLEYAEWIADVCREAPDVAFWIYTRSFEFLAPLVAVSTIRGGNLAINLSADADNIYEATDYAVNYAVNAQGTGPSGRDTEMLRIAYLTVDGTLPNDDGVPSLDDDDVIFPDYSLRPRGAASLQDSVWWQGLTPAQRKSVCPVDAFGKGETMRCGPCKKCLT